MKMSKNLVLRREDPRPRKHQVRIPFLLLLPPLLLPLLLFPLLWWWRSFISARLQLREVLIERMPFSSISLCKAESVISHRPETAAHLWPCILQICNSTFSFLSFSSSSRAFSMFSRPSVPVFLLFCEYSQDEFVSTHSFYYHTWTNLSQAHSTKPSSSQGLWPLHTDAKIVSSTKHV